MIKEFFYVGRKFVFEGHEYEVLENNAEVSKMKGWLHLKTLGPNGYYPLYIHPRKILFVQPDLKELLDKSLENLGGINTEGEMEHEQMELF